MGLQVITKCYKARDSFIGRSICLKKKIYIYIYIYKREKKKKNQTCVESADQVRIKCNFQFTMLNEGTHVTIIFKSLWKIHFCSQSRWKFNRICSALFQVLFGTSTVPHISGGLEMTKKYVKRPVQVKRNEGLESLD